MSAHRYEDGKELEFEAWQKPKRKTTFAQRTQRGFRTFGVGVVGVLFFSLFIFGPGGTIAAAEFPFGVGPFSPKGMYCSNLHVFAADMKNALANPSMGTSSQAGIALKNIYEGAPNPTVKNLVRAWVSAQYSLDNGKINSATNQLNHWITSNCSDFAYTFPFTVSGFFAGFSNALPY